MLAGGGSDRRRFTPWRQLVVDLGQAGRVLLHYDAGCAVCSDTPLFSNPASSASSDGPCARFAENGWQMPTFRPEFGSAPLSSQCERHRKRFVEILTLATRIAQGQVGSCSAPQSVTTASRLNPVSCVSLRLLILHGAEMGNGKWK